MSSLPANVTISSHPCLVSKLSLLRSASTSPKETSALVHELSLILATEALGKVLTTSKTGEKDVTPLGVQFDVEKVTKSITLVPILRSGLGMLEGASTIIPPPQWIADVGGGDDFQLFRFCSRNQHPSTTLVSSERRLPCSP